MLIFCAFIQVMYLPQITTLSAKFLISWLISKFTVIHTCVKKYASQLADIAGHDQALSFKVYKKFSCSTQQLLSMKFFLQINVEMPTIVGISIN